MRRTEFITEACDPHTLTVGMLMQDTVITCNPSTNALSLCSMMTKRNFGSVPVVDAQQVLVGIVTAHDLSQAMIAGRDLRKVIEGDPMASQVLTVTEEMSLVAVANLFQDRYVTRVPVVREKKLMGILARRDLLLGYMKASQYWS